MSNTWKTIRVFLSSTFRDMHAERDHLLKVTFPALREQLLPYRVELYDIDLRWGITEDEAKNEKVIGLCLDQVDECRPFFLAFLGQRYGWVPAQVPHETQTRFPFVQRFPGVSVTELELRHGITPNPKGNCTLILLRNEATLATIPEAPRQRDFLESDPHLQQKLQALRQELEAGPFLVRPYSASWDPQRYDRVNRTAGKLHGLDDFGQQVEDWLWQAIVKELQLPDAPATVDSLDAEADLHERFLEMRTRIYLGRDDLYRRLRDVALASGETPLLLTGESGLGKSAALARFVRDFRKEQPEVFVLAHFVGASPQTTALTGMLQRLTQELQRKFQLTLPKAESPEAIIGTFIVAITSLPESARVVLAFDALNQLDADSRADSLVWLPEKLPLNVRVLCSSATGPQNAPRVLSAFGARKYVDVPLQPLGADERRAIVQAVPKLVAKTLDDRQIAALLANPATHNPLFLMVALEELRGYGSFERLDQMMAGLPRDGDTVTKLFEQVFERLEQEFNQPLVEETLRLLACSRRGLSGPELVELTRSLGDDADDLYPVLRQLRSYLQVRAGLFDFYHLSIRRAVESRYLQWHNHEDQRDPWARWNPARPEPACAPTEPEREARQRLIDFFAAQRLEPRALAELPWQLCQLQNWPRLFDLLGDLPFFDAAWQANELDVRTAWALVKTVGGLEPIEAYRGVLADPTGQEAGSLWRLALSLADLGHADAVLPLWSVFIDYFHQEQDELNLAGALGNQALILKNSGHLDEALRLLKEVEAICRRLNDSAGLASTLGNQAVILKATGDLDGAMRLHKEQEAIRRQLNDQAGLASSLGNQSLILKARGDLEGAVRLLKEVEVICRRLNDAAGLQKSLGNQAGILITAGDLSGAMRLLKETETIWRRLNDPAELQGCLGNQGLVLKDLGDLPGALRLHQEEAAICRDLNDPVGLQRSLGNQTLVMRGLGDLDEALRLVKAQEAICQRLNNPTALAANFGIQALILRDRGDLDGALRLHQEEAAICREFKDSIGLQRSLERQVSILKDTGDLDGALRLLEEEETLCRRLNNQAGLIASLENQGSILFTTGNLDGALPVVKELEALCRRSNDVAGLCLCLGNEANILKAAGDLDGALRLFKEEATYRPLDDLAGVQRNLGDQAAIQQAAGDLAEALRLLKEQEAICRRLKDQTALYRCLGTQGQILSATWELDGALLLIKEVEAICRGLNDPRGLAIALNNQATLLAFKQRRWAEAFPLAEEALDIATQHGLSDLVQQIEPLVNATRLLGT